MGKLFGPFTLRLFVNAIIYLRDYECFIVANISDHYILWIGRLSSSRRKSWTALKAIVCIWLSAGGHQQEWVRMGERKATLFLLKSHKIITSSSMYCFELNRPHGMPYMASRICFIMCILWAQCTARCYCCWHHCSCSTSAKQCFFLYQ